MTLLQSSQAQPSAPARSRRIVWILFLLATITIAGHNSSSAQSTNIDIGATVKLSSAKRLGVNLAGQDFYDSGQMLRNLIFRNPGFEGEFFQNILDCVAVTATSCTDSNVWNIWPANFLKGATFEVINGAAQGETGVVTASTISAYEAGNSSNPNYGVTVSFAAPATPLAVGDHMVVRIEVPGNAQDGWWTGVSGGATLATDFTDLAPDSPGKQALELKALTSGQSAHVNAYFDSSQTRAFVQLNGAYTLAFKAKGLGGNNQLSITMSRLGAENLFSKTVTLTNQWQDYTYIVNASETGNSVGTVQLSFSIAGADIYIDDTTFTEAAAANNPTAYRNAVVDTLRTLQPGVIRYMAGTDWGSSIANVVAVPFARERAAFSNPEQDDAPMGLQEFLVLCQTVGAEPWYTMAGGASATDMQNLIEFLGGAATTPFGAKRAALGQTAPWTTVFPIIHIELGNEMWNGSGGATIADPVIYGQRAAKIFASARASASYTPAKFDLIMGSWAVNAWWTEQEMANSSGYDSVDAAPYLFYSLSDTSSNEAIFAPMFAQPEQLDSRSSGYMAQQAQAAASGKIPAKVAIYEVNLSTVSGTAPQNVVNQVVGGVGAGITVADHMLLMMRDLGITTQNMFALTEYGNGFSNPNIGGETTPLWGSVIDMGGETNVRRPQYLAEQLVNTAIFPTMLTTVATGANPTWNQALSANDTITPIQLTGAHYLQSFAFTNGTQKSVIVFNLSRSGSLPVTFTGVNAPTGDVLISQLTSKNITDNNEGLTSNSPVVVPTHINVASFNPTVPYSLPPYSMTVFIWPGAALPATKTTIEASPTSSTVGQSVTLTGTVDSVSGSGMPTGKVSFSNGSTSLGSATLNASGLASLATTALPAGTDSLTAAYSGDASNAGSTSAPLTFSVAPSAVSTTTTLTASATQIQKGQSVTFTATVKSQTGSGIAAGSVTFLDGATSLGASTLNSSGIATLSTSSLALGSHSVTASYGGGSSDLGSVSTAVAVTVANYTFNFSSGFAASKGQVQLNGSTALAGSSLELTNGGANQAGSAFYATPVDIQAFTTDFTFQLTNPNADGFTFTIQNAGPAALGGRAAGLGYVNIQNSVAVKFDLFNNAGEGADSTGLYVWGNLPTVPSIDLTETGINLHSGDTFAAHITYDGTDLTLTLTDKVTLAVWTHSWPIDIPSTVGGSTAYVGFTGGTGDLSVVQEISSWTYTSGAPALPNFPAGFDGTGLVLNKGANVAGSLLQLTNGTLNEATSAWFGTPVNIGSFTTDFDFQLLSAKADGFTFVIQNSNINAVGGPGGGLGYSGISHSVAIKFDIYSNAGEGSDSTGAYVSGASPTVPSIDLTASKVVLASGDTIHAHIVYDGAKLTWTLTDTTLSTRPSATNSATINIPSTVGGPTAYVGFTAGTGGMSSVQTVAAWSFTNGQ